MIKKINAQAWFNLQYSNKDQVEIIEFSKDLDDKFKQFSELIIDN